MPHVPQPLVSEPAEMSALGAMMSSADALQQGLGLLRPEHFGIEKHRQVLHCIKLAHDEGYPVNIGSVTGNMAECGYLRDAGGDEFMQQLLQAGASPGHFDSYLEKLRDAAWRRAHLQFAEQLAAVTQSRAPGEVRQWLDDSLRRLDNEHDLPGAAVETHSAVELLEADFPPLEWVIEGLVPVGLTLLAGAIRSGKSSLGLSLACAVAGGGSALGYATVKPGEALYLALEDQPRRLQTRLRAIGLEPLAASGLTLATRWPSLDQGGLRRLGDHLQAHPDCRLVVIDSLRRFSPKDYGGADPLVALRQLAHRHRVAVLVLHHVARVRRDDPEQCIASLADAADAILVLQRQPQAVSGRLTLAGPELEPADLLLQAGSGRWERREENSGVSAERQAILALLEAAGGEMTPREIAAALGTSDESIRRLLGKMTRDTQLRQASYGNYALPTQAPPAPSRHSGNTGNSGHSGHSGHSEIANSGNSDDSGLPSISMPTRVMTGDSTRAPAPLTASVYNASETQVGVDAELKGDQRLLKNLVQVGRGS